MEKSRYTIHTATSAKDAIPDGTFDTGFVAPGQSSQPMAIPTKSGQYPYLCILHTCMIGTVTVS